MYQDKDPQAARLTLTAEVAPLISRFGGSEIPAVLYNCGELDGSGIALKGSAGGELTFDEIVTLLTQDGRRGVSGGDCARSRGVQEGTAGLEVA